MPTGYELAGGVRVAEEECCQDCSRKEFCSSIIEEKKHSLKENIWLPRTYCRQCGRLWVTLTVSWTPEELAALPERCPWKLRWNHVCITCGEDGCGEWKTHEDDTGKSKYFDYEYEKPEDPEDTGKRFLRLFDMRQGYTPESV